MKKKQRFFFIPLFIFTLLSTGCFAKTPPKVDGQKRSFTDHEIGFSITLPEGWDLAEEKGYLFRATFTQKRTHLVTVRALALTEIPYLRHYLRIASFEQFPRRMLQYTRGRLSNIKELAPKRTQFGGKPIDEIVWAAEREGIAVILHTLNLPLETVIVQLHFEFPAALYNNADEAIRIVLEGITILPGSTPPPERVAANYRLIGDLYKGKSLWDEARMAFQQAVNAQPDNAELYVLLGESNFRIESFDRALKAYENALALSADHAPAYKGLGETLLKLGKFDEGIAALKRGLILTEEDAPYYLLLGNAYLDKGETQEAIRAFQNLLRKKALETEAHLGIGKAYLASELFDQAIFELREAARNRPEDKEPHCLLEKAYTEISALDDAAKEAALCKDSNATPS